MKTFLVLATAALLNLHSGAAKAETKQGFTVAPPDCTVPNEGQLDRHTCYINKYGNYVHVPSQKVVPSPSTDVPERRATVAPDKVVPDVIPDGATARCRDGAYSFSQHRPGTCSGHHGVAQWYVPR